MSLAGSTRASRMSREIYYRKNAGEFGNDSDSSIYFLSERAARSSCGILMTDSELVHQARAGEVSAYGELACRWSARVLAFCHARVGSADAEDLAQETLLRGWRALDTLTSPDHFGAWLRGIAQRICWDWLKSKQTSQVLFSALPEQTGGVDRLLASDPTATEQPVDLSDELRYLLAAVDELDANHREVLLLYYYHDVTYRDLAELLGVSMATINARLTQAR